MSLLNFVGNDIKSKIKENEANSLNLKNEEVEILTNKFLSEGMTPEKAKAEAEIQLFKPKPLPEINLEKTNKNSGKRIKVCFFINEEEYKKIVEKFKIIEQMEEIRIAGSSTNDFINKLLS